jgi:hypothetical protein
MEKSKFQKGLETNLNSSYTVLSPTSPIKDMAPKELIRSGGKKKRNEDKERSKARINSIMNN